MLQFGINGGSVVDHLRGFSFLAVLGFELLGFVDFIERGSGAFPERVDLAKLRGITILEVPALMSR